MSTTEHKRRLSARGKQLLSAITAQPESQQRRIPHRDSTPNGASEDAAGGFFSSIWGGAGAAAESEAGAKAAKQAAATSSAGPSFFESARAALWGSLADDGLGGSNEGAAADVMPTATTTAAARFSSSDSLPVSHADTGADKDEVDFSDLTSSEDEEGGNGGGFNEWHRQRRATTRAHAHAAVATQREHEAAGQHRLCLGSEGTGCGGRRGRRGRSRGGGESGSGGSGGSGSCCDEESDEEEHSVGSALLQLGRRVSSELGNIAGFDAGPRPGTEGYERASGAPMTVAGFGTLLTEGNVQLGSAVRRGPHWKGVVGARATSNAVGEVVAFRKAEGPVVLRWDVEIRHNAVRGQCAVVRWARAAEGAGQTERPPDNSLAALGAENDGHFLSQHSIGLDGQFELVLIGGD